MSTLIYSLSLLIIMNVLTQSPVQCAC
ncbi:hypothetical protein SEVIR_7G222602v4 [Setaria viridis]